MTAGEELRGVCRMRAIVGEGAVTFTGEDAPLRFRGRTREQAQREFVKRIT